MHFFVQSNDISLSIMLKWSHYDGMLVITSWIGFWMSINAIIEFGRWMLNINWYFAITNCYVNYTSNNFSCLLTFVPKPLRAAIVAYVLIVYMQTYTHTQTPLSKVHDPPHSYTSNNVLLNSTKTRESMLIIETLILISLFILFYETDID